jgi:hypothetical protein
VITAYDSDHLDAELRFYGIELIASIVVGTDGILLRMDVG